MTVNRISKCQCDLAILAYFRLLGLCRQCAPASGNLTIHADHGNQNLRHYKVFTFIHGLIIFALDEPEDSNHSLKVRIA